MEIFQMFMYSDMGIPQIKSNIVCDLSRAQIIF